MGIATSLKRHCVETVSWQSPAVLVNAQADALGLTNLLSAGVQANKAGKPEISTGHQQLTRMGIVGGIHPVALQFRKSSPQPCWCEVQVPSRDLP